MLVMLIVGNEQAGLIQLWSLDRYIHPASMAQAFGEARNNNNNNNKAYHAHHYKDLNQPLESLSFTHHQQRRRRKQLRPEVWLKAMYVVDGIWAFLALWSREFGEKVLANFAVCLRLCWIKHTQIQERLPTRYVPKYYFPLGQETSNEEGNGGGGSVVNTNQLAFRSQIAAKVRSKRYMYKSSREGKGRKEKGCTYTYIYMCVCVSNWPRRKKRRRRRRRKRRRRGSNIQLLSQQNWAKKVYSGVIRLLMNVSQTFTAAKRKKKEEEPQSALPLQFLGTTTAVATVEERSSRQECCCALNGRSERSKGC